MTRDERQTLAQERFIAADAHGTIEACPAWGKTRVALNLIQFMRRTHAERSVLIVVPQNYLKIQWEALLKSTGIIKNITVEVINTAIKKKRSVDFLILDRILSRDKPIELRGTPKVSITKLIQKCISGVTNYHSIVKRLNIGQSAAKQLIMVY